MMKRCCFLHLLFLTALVHATTTHNAAMQLLRPNDEMNRTSLTVVESTLAYLETLQGPVAVVAITGPYHTGKSFLLNQVVRSIGGQFEDQDEIFPIGRDVNPETSGVWMHHRSLTRGSNGSTSSSEETVNVLFLDTEGFSVSNVTEGYDAKVFAASTLLSSLLIYNSMHNLHAGELEYLDLLLHNTQLFSIKTALKQEEELKEQVGGGGGSGQQESSRFPFLPFFRSGGDESGTASLTELFRLPPLLVSVQAFTMQFAQEDADCTAWLTRLLSAPVRSSMGARETLSEASTCSTVVGEECGTTTPATDQLQHMGIGTLFPSVSCQTLFLPATSHKQLTNLADVPLPSMTPEFLQDLAALNTGILSHLEPKRWQGGNEPLSGPAFVSLVRLVVDALSSGDLTNIPGRWELYEGYLRKSSVRAALSGFEHEVKRLKTYHLTLAAQQQQQEGATLRRPLTQHELAGVLQAAGVYAQALGQKLLVGLMKSYQLASKEVNKGIATIKAVEQADHAKAVQTFLRNVADDVLGTEWDEMAELISSTTRAAGNNNGGGANHNITGLPMVKKALDARIAAWEKVATMQYQTATRLFKDETSVYAAAGKHLAERVTAASDALRLQNKEALDAFLTEERFKALAHYERKMQNEIKKPSIDEDWVSLPQHIHRPDRLLSFHADAHATMLASFSAATRSFQGEMGRDWHVTKVKADAAAVLAVAQQANSQKLKVFCEGVKEEVIRGVALAVRRLVDGMDVDKLEESLQEVTEAPVKEYTRRLGASVHATEEGRAVGHALSEALAVMHGKTRKTLADKLRLMLEEPLIYVCKRVITAKCNENPYPSVAKFRQAVHKECEFSTRKHEVGKRLSKHMMTEVIDQFIESELQPCRKASAAREMGLGLSGWTVVWLLIGLFMFLSHHNKA